MPRSTRASDLERPVPPRHSNQQQQAIDEDSWSWVCCQRRNSTEAWYECLQRLAKTCLCCSHLRRDARVYIEEAEQRDVGTRASARPTRGQDPPNRTEQAAVVPSQNLVVDQGGLPVRRTNANTMIRASTTRTAHAGRQTSTSLRDAALALLPESRRTAFLQDAAARVIAARQADMASRMTMSREEQQAREHQLHSTPFVRPESLASYPWQQNRAQATRTHPQGRPASPPKCRPEMVDKLLDTFPLIPCDEDSDDMCCICLEEYEAGDKLRMLGCLHKFHVECIALWANSDKSLLCPVCKHPLMSNPP